MPLRKVAKKAKKSVKMAAKKANFHELRHSKTYARTLRKFGSSTANRQMVAISLQASGLSRKKARKVKRK